jgi:hypothetical protein
MESTFQTANSLRFVVDCLPDEFTKIHAGGSEDRFNLVVDANPDDAYDRGWPWRNMALPMA